MTWSRANGDVDQYEVQLLFNDMKVFPPIYLVNTATEYQFSALTPGRHYKILVLTISGDVQQSAFIEGLTGKWKYFLEPGWTDAVLRLRCLIVQVFRLRPGQMRDGKKQKVCPDHIIALPRRINKSTLIKVHRGGKGPFREITLSGHA